MSRRLPDVKPTRVGFVSLGCPKNTVDSEVMLGHLQRAGAELIADADAADVVVINTCSFIDAAKEESVDTILAAVRRKQDGLCRRVVVAGCMVQRYRQELAAEIPEVDAFVDLDSLAGIAAAVGLGDEAPRGTAPGRVARPLPVAPAGAAAAAGPRPATYLYDAATPRLLSGPAWSAYLKIAEGCDNTCAFCAIPRFRGAFRSRPLADIVAEARSLAAAGVLELNLIAQDSTAYGSDLGLRHGPTRLMEALAAVEGLRWIRLFYVYPNKIEDSLLAAMGEHPRIAAYIDIPLQHASREVLARMRRGGSGDGHLRLLERIRRFIPDVSIRSTVITGFPGETAADHAELLRFVAAARFDHLGAFTYSHEDHTTAYGLEDDVPEQVKEDRRGEVMTLQEEIAAGRNSERLGSRLTVLCEGPCDETEHLLQGRHQGQAPEVDGRVLINEGQAAAGQMVTVEITEAHPFDLVGRAVGPA